MTVSCRGRASALVAYGSGAKVFCVPLIVFYFAYRSPLTERRLWGLGVFFCAVVSIHDFQFNLSPLGINSALIPQVPRV